MPSSTGEDRLRGRAEVRAGVYVGPYSGFDFETIGANRREPADFDGLTLVRFLPPAPDDLTPT
ncbi:MAG: hypothetical protein C0497_14345 [Gemmatimonas sp.]|nr:hypothetical protein [Gemmatimonas sp.]